MVKIAIVGYGKMGQIIEKIALDKGHEVCAIIDPVHEKGQKGISAESLNGAEVCIDFTHPDVIIDNIKKIASLKINIVVGTTGWYDQMDQVKKIVEDSGIGLIWSGNFSIGVNAFFKIIENASKVFNKLDDYDPMSIEFHHKNKADSPSGTANMIGKILIDNIDRKEKLVYDKLDRKIEPNELHVASVRGGAIPGIHSVIFDSEADTIELKHTARNREGFASGAVMAAEFVSGKKGMFEIDDLMNEIVK